MLRVRESGRGIKPGDKIGKRTVLGWQFSRGRDYINKPIWCAVVRCACGKISTTIVKDLRSGNCTDCGCGGRCPEGISLHGFRDEPLYTSWSGMRRRCYHKRNPKYPRYGGRGITVCQEWRGSNCYPAFRAWAIENGYKPGLTLERKENDGNYEPANCRWATRFEQSQNTSLLRMFTAFGETKHMAAWLRDPRCVVRLKSTIYDRIERGMTNEEAMSLRPARAKRMQLAASA